MLTEREGGDVGLLDAVAIEVGLVVGGALFSLTGVATGIAGTGVFVSFALAFGVVVLGLVPTAMLGAAFPTTGGNYRYPREFVSPFVAFLAAWGLGVSMFGGGLPLYALTFGGYVESLVAVDPVLVGLVVLTAFFLLNLAGIRTAARAQVLLFVALVAALGVFVVVGAPAVDAANLTPPFSTGATGLVAGAAILYFVCLGANFVVDIGGDVREATVTLPQSLAISVPLVLCLYVATAVVAVGSVGVDALANEELTVPAEAFLSPGLRTFFVVGGALFAITTSINAVYIIVPKYLDALAADGLVPAVLAETNERFGTAHWGLTLVYLLSVAALVSPLPVADLGTLLGFGGIFLIVPVMLAAVRAVRRRPDAFERVPSFVGRRATTVLAVSAVACNALLFVVLATQSPVVCAAWVGLVVVGAGYYLARTRFGRREREAEPLVEGSA
ncbi:APC family permease [Halomarina salina]|uniref:APC family permease n=1 Tax=Halomarina salina TaxID=1872699 RepID=A0ABD5RRB0_9EURY